jgi:hypothetical protein
VSVEAWDAPLELVAEEPEVGPDPVAEVFVVVMVVVGA